MCEGQRATSGRQWCTLSIMWDPDKWIQVPRLGGSDLSPLNDLTSLDFKLLNIGLEPTTVKLRVSHSID